MAGRENGFAGHERRRIVRRAVRAYRETMRDLATRPMLDVWYARLDMDELLPRFRALLDPKATPSVWRAVTKARAHDSHQAFEKLCTVEGGEPRIVSDPPLILPVEALLDRMAPDLALDGMQELLTRYRRACRPTGAGCSSSTASPTWPGRSSGSAASGPTPGSCCSSTVWASRCFLQVKEAEASVLERFTRPSPFEQHGQRVVAGQRLMQAASDIFLGWERFAWDGRPRDYYLRQLRDWKGSADVAGMTPAGMELWGRMCGWTLARAHARSGDRVAIAAYLGKGDVSTAPWPPSRRPTPPRTSSTTARSGTPSRAGGSPRRPGPDRAGPRGRTGAPGAVP